MRPSSGMGCHLNAGIALSRALTEAAQSRLTFISGARDDLKREDYKVFLQPNTYEEWSKELKSYSFGCKFKDVVSLETNGLKTDMDMILNRLKQRGIEEVITVDLTKPEFSIPVIRMIIPGLEAMLFKSDSILGQRASKIIMKN